jgi:hypothetical protein
MLSLHVCPYVVLACLSVCRAARTLYAVARTGLRIRQLQAVAFSAMRDHGVGLHACAATHACYIVHARFNSIAV